VLVTAVTGLIATGATTVVPWSFWSHAQDPLRRLPRGGAKAASDVGTGTQLLALHENAVREATRARATAPLPDESESRALNRKGKDGAHGYPTYVPVQILM
jgi:hypothetical protein